jgi:ADP-glucose pyrophosphorylase
MAPKAKRPATPTTTQKNKAAVHPPGAPRLIDVQPYDAFDAGLNPWLVLSIVNAGTLRPMALGVHVQRGGGLRHTKIAVSRLQHEHKRLGANETAKTVRAYQRVLNGARGAP